MTAQERAMIPTRIEIIPSDGIVEKVRASVPLSTPLTVTCLPHHGIARTVQVARCLSEEGYRVMPHLAARTVSSKSGLRQLVRDCQRSGISDVLVIGGDAPEATGPYPSAISLMRDIAEISSGSLSQTIAGYPEGHPLVKPLQLLGALLEKQELAASLVTQICFSPTKVLDYVRILRHEGITLPVYAGVPGLIERTRLIALAGAIGVGPSIKLLTRQGPLARRLLSGGHYSPETLIAGLGNAGLAGIHLHSMNNLDLTTPADPENPGTTTQQRRILEHELR